MSTAKVVAVGPNSCINPSRFGPISSSRLVAPVRLPPGRYLSADKIGRQTRQSIIVTFRPAVFDKHIAAFDIARFGQALAEDSRQVRIFPRRRAIEKPNHRHRRLLRARSKRPRGRRAAEKRDEWAALP